MPPSNQVRLFQERLEINPPNLAAQLATMHGINAGNPWLGGVDKPNQW